MALHVEYGGIGVIQAPSETDAPAEPEQKREGVLGEVERLQHEGEQRDLTAYYAIVTRFARGFAVEPNEIKAALDDAGRSINQFESDASDCKRYDELRAVLATSASLTAEQQTLDAAGEKAAKAVDAAHDHVARARQKLLASQEVAQAAEDARFGHAQDMAELDGAMRELTTSPELVPFATDSVREACECLVVLQQQRDAARGNRDKARTRAIALRREDKSSRERRDYLGSLDYSNCGMATRELELRRGQDAAEIGAMEQKLANIQQRLERFDVSATTAEVRVERLDGEVREARVKLIEALFEGE